jgi:dTDP-4-dehydrorhamnose 3,5-epimerase
VVDLRIQSPTYGKFEVFSLSAEKANMVYIPIGLAHGFEVLSETAIMMYKVSSVYSPEHDTGILWNSVNIPWQIRNPIISQRDQSFIEFPNFRSLF